MRFTIKQFYDFQDNQKRLKGSLISSAESWDIIRTANEFKESPFFTPDNRDDWILKIQKMPELFTRGERIVRFLKDKRFRTLSSFGVGGVYRICDQNFIPRDLYKVF